MNISYAAPNRARDRNCYDCLLSGGSWDVKAWNWVIKRRHLCASPEKVTAGCAGGQRVEEMCGYHKIKLWRSSTTEAQRVDKTGAITVNVDRSDNRWGREPGGPWVRRVPKSTCHVRDW